MNLRNCAAACANLFCAYKMSLEIAESSRITCRHNEREEFEPNRLIFKTDEHKVGISKLQAVVFKVELVLFSLLENCLLSP